MSELATGQSNRAATIDILDAHGGKSGTLDLPAEVFDTQVNIPLIHQVVIAQLAAARQGTHSTLTRGEVAGGGRKPYRQKGTGRARQGSIRAPQFAGGGVVHGPTPRDYSQRTPKKMKVAALRGALSDRARDGRVHVVESIVTGASPSTKAAIALLAKVSERPRVLVVLERGDDLAWMSLRNATSVHALTVDQLNTYDVLLCDDVVFTKAAFDVLVAGATTGKSVKAVATSTEAEGPAARPANAVRAERAAHAADESQPDGPGSAAPLESGEAPEGFTIKGNKNSMKYHQPDGQWYEQTEAEVWFASADDAEQAGFVEAGSQASIEANPSDPDEAESEKEGK
ncbi:MAG: 50S ribosomal protein L4 [Propionibacteriales bacterium]|nr:50S ribosomal protein L4 [Propionibacteriales bacterium]